MFGPFEIWVSRLLSSCVVANHIIGCGLWMVFLHIREGFPCELIGILAYIELKLAILISMGSYGEHWFIQFLTAWGKLVVDLLCSRWLVVIKLTKRIIIIQNVVSTPLFSPSNNIYWHSVRVMVTRGGLTDQMCCWVQIVVVVLLVIGKVSCIQHKLIGEFGYPGSFLALLVVRGA